MRVCERDEECVCVCVSYFLFFLFRLPTIRYKMSCEKKFFFRENFFHSDVAAAAVPGSLRIPPKLSKKFLKICDQI